MLLGQWKREIAGNYLERVRGSLALLSEEEIWWRPNDASNSVGNLVLHLSGNLRQWIISALGGAADVRDRDLEFAEKGPIPRDILLAKLEGTIHEATEVLAKLSPGALGREYSVQGMAAIGWDIPGRIFAHFAYHAGQIVYFAKMRRASDLGFTRLPAARASRRRRR